MLMPYVPRQRLMPLKIDEHVRDELKIFYFFPKQMEISRSYLECLCSISGLRAKGIKYLEHKQPKAYYEQLLGRYVDAGLAIMDDDSAVNRKMVMDKSTKRKQHHEVVARALAIEDGAPDEESDGHPSSESDGGEVVAGGYHEIIQFGPFAIRGVQRVSPAGVTFYQWECTCKYHRDPVDALGTQCKKTLQWNTPAEKATTLAQLKNWSLMGRGCHSRAIAPGGHKFIDPRTLPVFLDERLDRLLAWALKMPTWIVDRPDLAPKTASLVAAAPKAKPAPKAAAAKASAASTSSSSSSSSNASAGN